MSVTVRIGFSEASFAEKLAAKVRTVGARPVDAVEHLLTQILVENFHEIEAFSLLKSPLVKLHPMYFKDRCASLAQMAQSGYETWYIEVAFSTKDAIDKLIFAPNGLVLNPINYADGPVRYQFRSKQLKTQSNHVLKFGHVVVPPSVFMKAIRVLDDQPSLEQPFIANPRPGPRSSGFELGIEGFEFVAFDHSTNGSRHFCTCAQTAHVSMLNTAKNLAPNHVKDAWPYQVIRLLSGAIYKENVCHLCIAEKAGPDSAAYLYGDAVQEFSAPYIDQIMLTRGFDKTTARAEVQQVLGLSRWVSEAEMYSLTKKIFPDHVVMREASPSWLGRQRLDVYLPSLALALEYQGQQHYKAVGIFGGEAALQRNLERDALKKRLCEENSVRLIEIRFDEPLTIPHLRQRLRQFVT